MVEVGHFASEAKGHVPRGLCVLPKLLLHAGPGTRAKALFSALDAWPSRLLPLLASLLRKLTYLASPLCCCCSLTPQKRRTGERTKTVV